ncbi:MAG TPA: hypothetical protein PLD62_01270 [Candidatus Cloacimonadota bacterium]|nr:hypothetical protein [Candidatus Cloacimonadota bacterium]
MKMSSFSYKKSGFGKKKSQVKREQIKDGEKRERESDGKNYT